MNPSGVRSKGESKLVPLTPYPYEKGKEGKKIFNSNPLGSKGK
jgi:hypothetical protein